MKDRSRLSMRTRLREHAVSAGLLLPPLSWLSTFFLLPVGIVAAYSVGAISLFPGDTGFTWDSWKYFFSGSVYIGLFWKSVRMALTISIVALVLAYPVAYYLAFGTKKRKYVLLLLVLAPFFASYFLRILAWKVILGDQGVVNSLFYWLGRDPDHPLPQLLYSQFTVMLVLAYIWVPFVALPIFVSLENIDRSLFEAASDLGASKFATFRKIIFPMSLPGVMAAFVFVFVPTIGEFVTPLLVGGTNGFMYGNAVRDLFLSGFDWQLGSVLALFLLGVVALVAVVFSRFLNVRGAEA